MSREKVEAFIPIISLFYLNNDCIYNSQPLYTNDYREYNNENNYDLLLTNEEKVHILIVGKTSNSILKSRNENRLKTFS